MALIQRKDGNKDTNLECEGFSVKSLLKNAKVTRQADTETLFQSFLSSVQYRMFFVTFL